MVSYIAGFMPEHNAYKAAIPYGAVSVVAGLSSAALFFYATILPPQPKVALTITAYVLGVLASALHKATVQCATAAAKKKDEPFNSAQFKKDIVGAIGLNLSGQMAGAGTSCFKCLISQSIKTSVKDVIKWALTKD